MDIPAMSIGLSQGKVKQEVQMSVLKMVMDTAKGQAADMAKLMESTKAIELSVAPHLGSGIDIRA